MADKRQISSQGFSRSSCRLVTPGASWPATLVYLSYDAVRVLAPAGCLGLGDSLTLELDLPDSAAPFVASGEVRSAHVEGRNAQYGIRLVLVNHKQRREISRILDLMALPSGPRPLEPETANGRVGFL